jgi:hypothetical protein
MKTKRNEPAETPTNPIKLYGYLLLLLATFGLIFLGVYFFAEKSELGWREPAQQELPDEP